MPQKSQASVKYSARTFPVEVKTSVLFTFLANGNRITNVKINSNKEIPSQTGLPRGRKLKQHKHCLNSNSTKRQNCC